MQIHSSQKELFAQGGDNRLVGSGKASQRKQCWSLKRITETEWESQKGFGVMERPLQQLQGGNSRERQLVWGAWEWQTLCFSLGVCASEGGAPSAILFQNLQSTTVNQVTDPTALENRQLCVCVEVGRHQGDKFLNLKFLGEWGGSWIKKIPSRGQRSQEVIITREDWTSIQFKQHLHCVTVELYLWGPKHAELGLKHKPCSPVCDKHN